MASETNLSKAITSFSQALLNELSKDDGSANIFFSPFSISTALSMVMLGARGETAKQISEVLGFSEAEEQAGPDEGMQMQDLMQMQSQSHTHFTLQSGEDDVHSEFSKLLKDLNKPGAEYDLSTVNRLYGAKMFKFNQYFIDKAKEFYNAMMESVDFALETTVVDINAWVETETKGKIKDLLKSHMVDASTVMVLINAIYFKGKWAQRFKEENTIDVQFKINKNETRPVKMMTQKESFPFANIPEVNCKILDIAYEGKELSMTIFLPNEIEDDTTGLEKLEKELTYEKFKLWTQMLEPLEVEVKLPRFKMEVAYDLKKVLKRMGMVDAFDVSRSNFSGMSDSTKLVLSDVVHKAVVEVNEEGTEAAAATAAIISERSILIPTTFNADHPFLFFIRNKVTDTILFSGRFCCP